ncbi:MAG: extradiol ring-cleavage dioxygenase [Proteobacteria bacterium]|nr:extradiol ring-cleavage dioxygenase [Pseudomonadota bacterium]
MLNLGPEDWPCFAELDRVRPNLHKDGRPATYADLLAVAGPHIVGEITPERFTARHATVQKAIDRLAEELRRAELDALVVVGDDQHELYHGDNMPGALIYHGDTIANVPLRTRNPGPEWARRPEWSKRAAARYYEEREPRHYPVDAALARHLIGALVDAEFDVAVADHLPDGEGEGHAIAFVHKRIMTQGVLPVVPVFLNTYYPPNQPTPRRCYRLGQAIRAAIESYPKRMRVGVIASGGLSHFTVDEELDRGIIAALQAKDGAALQALPREKLQAGSSEIRNWICAAGAIEHLTLRWVEYQPGYRTPAGTGTAMCFAHWS